jgi:four helix bundle protein
LAIEHAPCEIRLHADKVFAEGRVVWHYLQIPRAATSIPCNVAEGPARNTKKDFAQFVSVARGSCAELETLVRLAIDIEIADPDPLINQQIGEVARMLRGLETTLRKTPKL